jgi:hypothetical protein
MQLKNPETMKFAAGAFLPNAQMIKEQRPELSRHLHIHAGFESERPEKDMTFAIRRQKFHRFQKGEL